MPRFDRYLLSQLTLLFGFFSLVLVSVYWVNRAVALFDQVIADGQSAAVFLEFTALSLPNVVRLVLPISAFVATVYVINRLSSESELVVAQATGVSPRRMAVPVVIFGLMVAVLMLVLNNFLVPASRAKLADRQAEISGNITARLLTEGQFIHPASGITFYLREITAEGELLDVFLSDARSSESRTTYTARRAFLVQDADGPKLIMFDGMAQTLSLTDQRLFTTNFKDFAYDISNLIQVGDRQWRDLREFSTWMLFNPSPAAMASSGASAGSFLYEAHYRIAQSFMPMVGALIGFAALMVGGFSRFGVWRQILLAVALLISLHLLDNLSGGVARKDPTLWWVIYVPNLLALCAAMSMVLIAENPGLFRRKRVVPA